MKNRKSRLKFIAEILSCQTIGSQEELLSILVMHNYDITQATLSRDLRRLHATKIAVDGGGFRYVIFNNQNIREQNIPMDELHPALRHPSSKNSASDKVNQDILSFAISRNLVVIKTRNGCAAGLAFDIDMLSMPEIIGSIPGTDTVLLVMDENLSREQIIQILMELIPDAITSPSLRQ